MLTVHQVAEILKGYDVAGFGDSKIRMMINGYGEQEFCHGIDRVEGSCFEDMGSEVILSANIYQNDIKNLLETFGTGA